MAGGGGWVRGAFTLYRLMLGTRTQAQGGTSLSSTQDLSGVSLGEKLIRASAQGKCGWLIVGFSIFIIQVFFFTTDVT